MDTNVKNPSSSNAKFMTQSSSKQAQKPLIVVAQKYSYSSAPTSSKVNKPLNHEHNTLQENMTKPAYFTTNPQPHQPPSANPYSWSVRPASVPVVAKRCSESGQQSPYSWKATPRTPESLGLPTSANSDTPRPPKISLHKSSSRIEPLTVSVNKDPYANFQALPRSPLQSFSPTGNSTECSCHRSPKLILCKSCGEIQRGRLSMTCTVHPRQVFLMDLNCCSSCKSTNLKEICDAKK